MLLRLQALGIKPKVLRAPKQPSLDKKELAQLMQKDDEEEDDANREAERIKGLGYSVYVSAYPHFQLFRCGVLAA